MSLPVHIEHNGNVAKITSAGELVVGPVEYDTTVFNTLDTINTAYNYYKPVSQKQLVITSIVVFADKDINDTTATEVIIYEADTEDTTTVSKTLLQFGMAKLSTLPIVPLRLLVTHGKYINVKTNDDDIHLTIMAHYIDIIK